MFKVLSKLHYRLGWIVVFSNTYQQKLYKKKYNGKRVPFSFYQYDGKKLAKPNLNVELSPSEWQPKNDLTSTSFSMWLTPL